MLWSGYNCLARAARSTGPKYSLTASSAVCGKTGASQVSSGVPPSSNDVCSWLSEPRLIAANNCAEVLSRSSFVSSSSFFNFLFSSCTLLILSSRMKKSCTFLLTALFNTESMEDGLVAAFSSFFNFCISSFCCFNNSSLLSGMMSPAFFFRYI